MVSLHSISVVVFGCFVDGSLNPRCNVHGELGRLSGCIWNFPSLEGILEVCESTLHVGGGGGVCARVNAFW